MRIRIKNRRLAPDRREERSALPSGTLVRVRPSPQCLGSKADKGGARLYRRKGVLGDCRMFRTL